MKKKLIKNPFSYQNIYCFTAEEIEKYIVGNLPPSLRRKIFTHLNKERCESCRRMYGELKLSISDIEKQEENARYDGDAIPAHKILPIPVRIQPSPPEWLAAGQIWTTAPRPRDGYGQVLTAVELARPVVIVMAGDGTGELSNIIRVLPISLDTDFHVKGEDLILENNSPLGYAIMLEIWNEKPMLAGNLAVFRGRIAEEYLRLLHELRDSFLDGKGKRIKKAVKEWRSREVDLTNYLNYPVNQSIWDDKGEVIIPLYDYDYALAAADAPNVDLDEPQITTLYEGDLFSAYIILKREIVILRIVSDEKTPPSVMIGKINKPCDENPYHGLYEFHLGNRDTLPESMILHLTMDDYSREFPIIFKRKADAI